MAEIGNSSRTIIKPYRVRTGGTFPIHHFPCSTVISTGVIRFGDVVQFDVTVATAAHRIIKSSTMANVPNVISTAFLGIAAEGSTGDGTSVGTEVLPVYLATKNVEFVFPTKLAGASHLSSLVGSRRALAYDSSGGFFYLDIGNSTAGDASVVVTEVIDAGTTNGLVVGQFISTNTARFVSAAF